MPIVLLISINIHYTDYRAHRAHQTLQIYLCAGKFLWAIAKT